MLIRKASFYLFLILIFLSGCSKSDIDNINDIIDVAEDVVSVAEELNKVVDQSTNHNGSEEYFPVIKVVDGDTISVEINEQVQKIRMIMVDTPEVHNIKTPEAYGPEASEFTKKMIEGNKVKLEYDREKMDPYDRLLAYVYLPDGRMVNEELLKVGLAEVKVYKPNNKYEENFKFLEDRAKEQGIGMWSK